MGQPINPYAQKGGAPRMRATSSRYPRVTLLPRLIILPFADGYAAPGGQESCSS
jgi:hypothetical protein